MFGGNVVGGNQRLESKTQNLSALLFSKPKTKNLKPKTKNLTQFDLYKEIN